MEQQTDSVEIGIIAACLADSFLRDIYTRSGRGYIHGLEEISAWAHEFSHAYSERLKDWDSFEGSPANIYASDSWDDFLTAWGTERLKQYLTKNKLH